MNWLKRSLSLLRFMAAYATANIQAAMEYRVSFFIQVFAMLANDSLWLFFWWIYFQQFPLTNGWQHTDVVILWSVAACSFGMSMGLFGNANKLSGLIMSGGLDAYLGMPRYVLLHVSIAASDPSSWGDVLFALGAFLLFLHPDLAHLALFLVLVSMVTLILTSFIVIFHSLAFFLGNTEVLTQQMLGALVNFSTYPMDIFHGAVKLLLFTVVPAGFISFLPLQLLHHFTWSLFGILVLATIVITLLAVGIFELGLRRYESGSLLGMQN